MAYDNFLVDKRIVERNIAKGLVDREAYKNQIESLPDREASCVHVSVDGEVDDDDDIDDDGDEGALNDASDVGSIAGDDEG